MDSVPENQKKGDEKKAIFQKLEQKNGDFRKKEDKPMKYTHFQREKSYNIIEIISK